MNAKFFQYTGPEVFYYATEQEADNVIAALRGETDDVIKFGEFFREIDTDDPTLNAAGGLNDIFWGETNPETKQAMIEWLS